MTMKSHAMFERRMIWQEFWSNYTAEEYKPPIFKKIKTNLPTKHPTPQALKIMLSSAKSELQDPKNRNKARPNLPKDELEALNQLIQLQKQKVITIKPCDKGAGIIILDFDAYIKSCDNHLKSEQIQPDGTKKPYYSKVSPPMLELAKTRILSTLQEAHEKDYISKDEFQAMDPSEKTPGRFYEFLSILLECGNVFR